MDFPWALSRTLNSYYYFLSLTGSPGLPTDSSVFYCTKHMGTSSPSMQISHDTSGLEFLFNNSRFAVAALTTHAGYFHLNCIYYSAEGCILWNPTLSRLFIHGYFIFYLLCCFSFLVCLCLRCILSLPGCNFNASFQSLCLCPRPITSIQFFMVVFTLFSSRTVVYYINEF